MVEIEVGQEYYELTLDTVIRIIEVDGGFVVYQIRESHSNNFGSDQVILEVVAEEKIKRHKWKLIVDTHLVGDLCCKRCGLSNEYAEPNQADGTYICYNCR